MVRAPWVALERRVKELVSRALRIPRSQRGVPAETLLGELGLTSFDAPASMHTLRVWGAIMARSADALPRLAWLELLNACNALPGGPPKYSLVARVKEVLESVGRSVWFTSGLPRDDPSDTGCRRRCSTKELLHNREADRWSTAVQTKPMLRSEAHLILDVGSRCIYCCGSRTPGGAGPHDAALGYWSPHQELIPAAGGSGLL